MAESIATVGYLAGLCVHDGTDWQKASLLAAISDTLAETKSNTDLAAGTNILAGTTVPAGEIWIVTQVAIVYTGVPPTNVQVNAIVGGVGVRVLFEGIIISGTWYTEHVHAVLMEDDYMQGRVDGATLHDVLSFSYLGYKIAAT